MPLANDNISKCTPLVIVGDEAFAMSQYMLRHYRMELNGEYATAHYQQLVEWQIVITECVVSWMEVVKWTDLCGVKRFKDELVLIVKKENKFSFFI